MREEHLILVNEHDVEIGSAAKMPAHEQGLLHRAFSVFVIRHTPDGWETLLQQRHADKYHCGGLWTNSCCSHPRVGESTLAGAHRRLGEELGLTLTLKHVGEFIYRAEFANGLIEHEYDHVFMGNYSNESFKLHPQEVSEVKWVKMRDLEQDLVAHPGHYTPWLKPALTIMQAALTP